MQLCPNRTPKFPLNETWRDKVNLINTCYAKESNDTKPLLAHVMYDFCFKLLPNLQKMNKKCPVNLTCTISFLIE